MVDLENKEVDEETAKEVQEDLVESDEDVSRGMRIGAAAQLVGLFLLIVSVLVAAVYFGYLTPMVTIAATVNIGWFVEYVLIAVLSVFVLYIFALVLIVLPGSVLNGIGGLAYGVAVAAGLVETDNNNENEE